MSEFAVTMVPGRRYRVTSRLCGDPRYQMVFPDSLYVGHEYRYGMMWLWFGTFDDEMGGDCLTPAEIVRVEELPCSRS